MGIVVLVFIASDDSKWTLEDFTAFLLQQIILQRRTSNPRTELALAKLVQQNAKPTLNELKPYLRREAEGLEQLHSVIDALDECRASVRDQFLALLQDVPSPTRLFFTSCPDDQVA